MTTLHDFTLKALDGSELPLRDFRGKAVLLVNVASRCGYTPQYKGLQALWTELRDRGLVVCGVPANEFGAQEPGTDQQIQSFCEARYQVTFPMASKLVVKGPGQHPLYAWLTGDASAPGDVQWNFEKFLIDREGRIAGRFRSDVTPESAALREALAKVL
ncbi:MAG: glutathione peroxidase [Deltaproteobacteria bacterium]|nr:glutathione peroxidase [Deltaproteobacteria bacterium]